MATPPLRAVVVDNSPTVRNMLVGGLQERGIEVVGTGADGGQAVELCADLHPDVLSLDLIMPGVDGFASLEGLRRRRIPVPVVIVSSVTRDGGDRAMRLLEAGAAEVLAKPMPGAPLEAFLDEYARTLHVAAQVQVEAIWRGSESTPSRGRRTRRASAERKLVVVAASTGGPRALHVIVECLPQELGCGMLVVQHMPAAFTRQLAARMDRSCAMQVREAGDGDLVAEHRILVAPGGRHMRLRRRRHVTLTQDPPVGGLRPRADVTIRDAVEQYGAQVLLVVLTGMGKDGLEGARAVRSAGGMVIVESSETALIDGMPTAVAGAGLANEVLPLAAIAEAICRDAG